jgi:hypothetical protein
MPGGYPVQNILVGDHPWLLLATIIKNHKVELSEFTSLKNV